MLTFIHAFGTIPSNPEFMKSFQFHVVISSCVRVNEFDPTTYILLRIILIISYALDKLLPIQFILRVKRIASIPRLLQDLFFSFRSTVVYTRMIYCDSFAMIKYSNSKYFWHTN